jgi:type I restriction enzyme R subunit
MGSCLAVIAVRRCRRFIRYGRANDSAVKVLGDETLRTIARELVETVRKNTTIDWTLRENVRAHLRVLVKRILRKYGYPPDKQEKATLTVLEQAEVLSVNWASV